MLSDIYLNPIDKDKGYIREALYLPNSKINTYALSQALTFYTDSKKKIEQFCIKESHIVVPRYFLNLQKLEKRISIEDLTPKKYKKISIKSNIILRNDLQIKGTDAIRDSSGVLVSPCGSGKTVMALYEIAKRAVPTLIIVNTEQLLDQWKRSINAFMSGITIGHIQASVFDWEHPITLAMLQTLSKRRDGIKENIRKYYGLIIWDEVDEISTPVYSNTADIFYGARIGLTATPNRKDGNERLFKYHIGDIVFENQEFIQKSKIKFIRSDLVINNLSDYYNKYSGRFLYGTLYTDISKDEKRNKLILDLVREKMREGRKTLVIGERRDQLQHFHEEIKGSGLCMRGIDIEERVKMLETCPVIFAIRRLSKRALDQKDLDTLIITIPMTDPGGIRQAVGRILREYEYKKSPEVCIIEDENIPPLKSMCNKMRRSFIEWGFMSSK